MPLESESKAGPPSPSFLTLVLKTFAGFGGGIAGMLVLLVFFLGASTVLGPTLHPETFGIDVGSAASGSPAKNPLFIFVFMAMIFLTSLAANLLGSLFFTFVEHEKYSRASTAMYQIFFINLVIFVLLAPLYLLLESRGLLDMVGFLTGFHVLVSALASMMILEIVGNLGYALVGVYGVIFAIMLSTGVMMLVYEFSGQNATAVLFSGLPVIWTALGFVTVIVEMLYRWIWTLYGSDFLMSKTSFGKDYGEVEPEDAPLAPDVSGSDFLKR